MLVNEKRDPVLGRRHTPPNHRTTKPTEAKPTDHPSTSYEPATSISSDVPQSARGDMQYADCHPWVCRPAVPSAARTHQVEGNASHSDRVTEAPTHTTGPTRRRLEHPSDAHPRIVPSRPWPPRGSVRRSQSGLRWSTVRPSRRLRSSGGNHCPHGCNTRSCRGRTPQVVSRTLT